MTMGKFLGKMSILSNALGQSTKPRQSITVTWLSGRKRTPGKCVYVNSVSRVRIPPSPPYLKKSSYESASFFFAFYLSVRQWTWWVEYVTCEFLSCLYGSERQLSQPLQDCSFLSCLYGSERSLQPLAKTVGFSKLPVRQWTFAATASQDGRFF